MSDYALSRSSLKKLSKAFIFERETVDVKDIEIAELKKKIYELEAELEKHQPNSYLEWNHIEDMKSNIRLFEKSDKPLKEDYLRFPLAVDYYLITITFPPKRFPKYDGMKDYLKYHVSNLWGSCNYIYATFEKTKAGIPHAHVLINPKNDKLYKFIQNDLNNAFLDKKDNEKAIKYDPVKKTREDIKDVIEYIEKSRQGCDKKAGYLFLRYQKPIKSKNKTVSKPEQPNDTSEWHPVLIDPNCQWCGGSGKNKCALSRGFF